MNSNKEKLIKYESFIKIIENINTPKFNRILLNFFEEKCQIYFTSILQENKNEYNEKCCEDLLLGISLSYLKKSIEYLYDNKDKNYNIILKLLAIAFIKTYCYYYVEINFSFLDKINWKEINEVFYDIDDEENQYIRNVRNIYLWRLYYSKFENFEQFLNYRGSYISTFKVMN